MKVESYENLVVWQKAIDLVASIYDLTKKFPKDEMFGLVSQMKRSAVSIPSNIAEGSRRGSKKDFRHFLINSFGSGAELETQLKIGKRLKFADENDYINSEGLLNEVMRMLNKMIYGLNNLQTTH